MGNIIFVMGMHRSGTSFLTGALYQAGAWLGDPSGLMQADAHNSEGYFEQGALAEALDSVLEGVGGAWHLPPAEPLWLESTPVVNSLLKTIRTAGAGTSVVKDPRLSLVGYSNLCEITRVERPRVIYCVRNPLEVARSLGLAHGLPLDLGLALWSEYHRSFCMNYKKQDVLIFDYSRFERSESYRQAFAEQLASYTGLSLACPSLLASWVPSRSQTVVAREDTVVDVPRSVSRQWRSLRETAKQSFVWTVQPLRSSSISRTLIEVYRLEALLKCEREQRVEERAAIDVRRSHEIEDRTALIRERRRLAEQLLSASVSISAAEYETAPARYQSVSRLEHLGIGVHLVDTVNQPAVLSDIATLQERVVELRLKSRTSTEDFVQLVDENLQLHNQVAHLSNHASSMESALKQLNSFFTRQDPTLVIDPVSIAQQARIELQSSQLNAMEIGQAYVAATRQLQKMKTESALHQDSLISEVAYLQSMHAQVRLAMRRLTEELERVSVECELRTLEAEHQRGQLGSLMPWLSEIRKQLDLGQTTQVEDVSLTSLKEISDEIRAIRNKNGELVKDVSFKQFQLESIGASESWKLGQAITAIPRRLRWILADKETDFAEPQVTHAIQSDQVAALTEPEAAHEANEVHNEAAPSLASFPESAFSNFDSDLYTNMFPDVARVVASGAIPSALHHYVHHGWTEGRAAAGCLNIPPRAPYRSVEQFLEVAVIGPFGAATGLGTGARGLERALRTGGVGVHPVWTETNRHWSYEAIDYEELLRVVTEFSEAPILSVLNADTIARSFIANNAMHLLNGHKSIGYWVWELPSLPISMFESFNYVDEIWVPSKFCVEAFSAVSPVPVRLVPHVVETGPVGGLARSDLGIHDDAFVFLYTFDASSFIERKNPKGLLKAFADAFAGNRNVELILKTHSLLDSTGLQEAVAEIADRVNVRLLTGRWSTEANNALKQISDAFVSPHRAEGFGLNVAEAMLLGKPVIATNYSGTTDFVNNQTGFPVDARLVSITHDIGPYQAHSVWADPIRDSLVDNLREVASGNSSVWRRARVGQEFIREHYSLEAVAGTARQVLESPASSQDGSRQVAYALTREIVTLAHHRTADGKFHRYTPTISIVVPVHNTDPELLVACINSVVMQTSSNWELCLVDDGSTNSETTAVLDSYRGTDPRIQIRHHTASGGISAATNAGIEMSRGEFVGFLDHDDVLVSEAVAAVTKVLASDRLVDVVYTDEDKIDSSGAFVDPHHKPTWSPELLDSFMYVCHFLVVRKSAILACDGLRSQYDGAQDYDLMLRLRDSGCRVAHVPEILYHWRKIPGSTAESADAKPYALEAGRLALQDSIERRYGTTAKAEHGLLHGTYRSVVSTAALPTVTLAVIASNMPVCRADGEDAEVLFERLLGQIREVTDYPRFKILIVDQQDARINRQQRKRLGLRRRDVATYRGTRETFNFARKANFAVQQATTEYAVLLNDDLEIQQPGWLRSLVDVLVDPQVGAVGPLLVRPDGRIQHAGLTMDGNGVRHLLYNEDSEGSKFGGAPHVVRNVLMVTGACLATKKSIFHEVGGFDEEFPIDFNDCDYCLKLAHRGYRSVYTPFARLVHHESRSLPREPDPRVLDLFRKKWEGPSRDLRDPYYPTAFRYAVTDFDHPVS